jgi:hypothetical protein
MEDLDIDPEGEQLIRIICGYIADALEEALEEAEEIEYFYGEPDPVELVGKHVGKKLDYLKAEGWMDV